jgi:hypothetical protein
VTLPSFARQTYVVAGIALAGLIGTLAALLVLDARAALFGALLAPWVAVIGWDLGVRMRNDLGARRSDAALQAALIDSTLDGICLTDADGNILISNAPLRRLSVELGMPMHGTVPQRLLAVSDRVAEPERYRRRMLELAGSVEAETSSSSPEPVAVSAATRRPCSIRRGISPVASGHCGR